MQGCALLVWRVPTQVPLYFGFTWIGRAQVISDAGLQIIKCLQFLIFSRLGLQKYFMLKKPFVSIAVLLDLFIGIVATISSHHQPQIKITIIIVSVMIFVSVMIMQVALVSWTQVGLGSLESDATREGPGQPRDSLNTPPLVILDSPPVHL